MMLCLRAGVLLWICHSSSVVSQSPEVTLTCDDRANFTCPDSPVSCECRGVLNLIWEVTSTATDPVFEMTFLGRDAIIGDSVSSNGYTAVICNVTGSGISQILTSKLDFTLSESLIVECKDNRQSPETVLLPRACYPSSSVNLRSTLTSTATDSVAVRLDWDPPLDNGGVAITSYLVFVNMSQEINSADTNTMFTLDSTGEHLIEISAVNECGIMGENVSKVINITDLNMLPTGPTATEDSTNAMETTTLLTTTTTSDTNGGGSNEQMRTIGIGAGVGVVAIVFIVAICIVVGALLNRTRKSKGTKLNGEEEVGGYSKFNFNMAPKTGRNGAPAVDPKIIEEEYSVVAKQNGPRPEARSEALLNPLAPVGSQYSVLEQKNGAEPAMIPDYDYCSVGAKPKKQPKKTEKSVVYIDVETSTERVNRQQEMFKPASDDVQYTAVIVKTHPADGLLNLDSLLLQLRVVQSKWDQIGNALNLKEACIQHIRKTTSGEDYDCLVEVCDEWLQSLRNRDMTPTWKAVGNALNRIGCKELSKEIKDIYKTGKLPRSPSEEVADASATGDAADSNYDDVVISGSAQKRQADLPQYDDIITSASAPPPIPPKTFDFSESTTLN